MGVSALRPFLLAEGCLVGLLAFVLVCSGVDDLAAFSALTPFVLSMAGAAGLFACRLFPVGLSAWTASASAGRLCTFTAVGVLAGGAPARTAGGTRDGSAPPVLRCPTLSLARTLSMSLARTLSMSTMLNREDLFLMGFGAGLAAAFFVPFTAAGSGCFEKWRKTGRRGRMTTMERDRADTMNGG